MYLLTIALTTFTPIDASNDEILNPIVLEQNYKISEVQNNEHQRFVQSYLVIPSKYNENDQMDGI